MKSKGLTQLAKLARTIDSLDIAEIWKDATHCFTLKFNINGSVEKIAWEHSQLAKQPACYAIIANGVVIYVGHTLANAHTRMNSHCNSFTCAVNGKRTSESSGKHIYEFMIETKAEELIVEFMVLPMKTMKSIIQPIELQSIDHYNPIINVMHKKK